MTIRYPVCVGLLAMIFLYITYSPRTCNIPDSPILSYSCTWNYSNVKCLRVGWSDRAKVWIWKVSTAPSRMISTYLPMHLRAIIFSMTGYVKPSHHLQIIDSHECYVARNFIHFVYDDAFQILEQCTLRKDYIFRFSGLL